MLASRLGLTRGMLSARATAMAPARIAPPYTNRLPSVCPFTTTARRGRSPASILGAYQPRTATQQSPKAEINRRMQANMKEVVADSLAMVIPGTFIAPPLSQLPKGLGIKLRFLGQWILIKGQEMLTTAALKFSSKPTIFKRARFKGKRSTLIPTAKALHRSMAQALAAGDKDTLNKITSRKLSGALLASIDKRPRGLRYGWELVRYTNKLFYPSIRSHKMSPVSRDREAPIIRQVVVAISSKQRRVVYDAQGAVVPGSEKEMDVVENVAMACIVDGRTWEQGEWRVIGTVKPTTYEGWMAEKAWMKTMLET